MDDASSGPRSMGDVSQGKVVGGRMLQRSLLVVWLVLMSELALTQPAIAPFADRPGIENALLADRLDTLLPQLMREQGIDLWLVIAREYNDDPVFLSLVPKPRFTARRTTMLLFHDRGPALGVERLTVSRYPMGTLYEAAWEGGDLDAQWQRLAAIIAERDPQKVAINVSATWPVADGLSHGLHQKLTEALGDGLAARLVSAENLVVRWLETRTPAEIEVWQRGVAIARATIAEAFSDAVITPGVTTHGRNDDSQHETADGVDHQQGRGGRPAELADRPPTCGTGGTAGKDGGYDSIHDCTVESGHEPGVDPSPVRAGGPRPCRCRSGPDRAVPDLVR